jgi:hypothetical protein
MAFLLAAGRELPGEHPAEEAKQLLLVRRRQIVPLGSERG